MREVTAAGRAPRRTALHGLEALTPRELQTAGLAAEGKSNREIAEALFVTVKTVEWHLRQASSSSDLARGASWPPLSDASTRRTDLVRPQFGCGRGGQQWPQTARSRGSSQGPVRCGRYTPHFAAMPAATLQ